MTNRTKPKKEPRDWVVRYHRDPEIDDLEEIVKAYETIQKVFFKEQYEGRKRRIAMYILDRFGDFIHNYGERK